MWKLTLFSAQKTIDEIVLFNDISGPNVHISHQTYDADWLGGEVKIMTYKVLGNRPHIWEPIEGNYNLFGTFSRNYGSYGSIQFERSESPAQSHQFEKTTLVELGLSFDQAYSLDEMKNKLPADVQVVWWWVDAYPYERIDYFQQDQTTISADNPFIYGFHSEQFKDYAYGAVDSFITSIERLKSSKNYKWEADKVYEALAGEDGKLEKSDVKIIGAIVSGTPEQLEVLQGKTYIKASTFGVISNLK